MGITFTSGRNPDIRGGSPVRAGQVLAMLALSLVLAAPSVAAAGSGRIGQPLPEAAWNHPLRNASGKVQRLRDWKGQRLVVNFWATWCAPCREEIPRLARLNGALQSRGGVVVAVSVDRDPVQVSRFLMTQAVAVPAVVDGPDGLARLLDLDQMPLTWLVDESGVIVDEVSGGSLVGLDRLAARALAPADRPAASTPGTVAEGPENPQ